MYPGFQICTDQPTCAIHVDSIWRWVTGVGAIPAVVAIWFRLKIKDPGLYDLDVKDHGGPCYQEHRKGLYGLVDKRYCSRDANASSGRQRSECGRSTFAWAIYVEGHP